jgi:hypothetical protein
MLSQTRNSRLSNGLTSTSLERAPGPSKNFVRGKSGYVPFWPGGLDDVLMDPEDENKLNGKRKGLRTVPPGFTRGLRLPGDESQDESLVELDEVSVTNHRRGIEGVRRSILQQAEDLTHITHNQHDEVLSESDPIEITSAGKASELDGLLPTTVRYGSSRHGSSDYSFSVENASESGHVRWPAPTACQNSKTRLGTCYRCQQAYDELPRTCASDGTQGEYLNRSHGL